MAMSMGGNNKRGKCRKKTGSESKLKPKSNNNYVWPWKYSIILTPIKNYRKSRVPM